MTVLSLYNTDEYFFRFLFHNAMCGLSKHITNLKVITGL